jgi:hypothetical protein
MLRGKIRYSLGEHCSAIDADSVARSYRTSFKDNLRRRKVKVSFKQAIKGNDRQEKAFLAYEGTSA